jgi:molybdopterin-binding protein
MKLSTRNIIKGKVVGLKVDGLMAKVKIDAGSGNIITAIVTEEAVKDLGVKEGEPICALVKATSVMLAKE